MITKDELIELGFYGQGRSTTGDPLYRYNFHSLHYEFQMEINNHLPDDNPNSGILSLYYKAEKDLHVNAYDIIANKKNSKKVDFIESEDENYIYGIKFVSSKEEHIPIAWHVNTIERLVTIIESLTNQKMK